MRILARAQWCHPDTCASSRPSTPGLSLPGKDWDLGEQGQGQGNMQGHHFSTENRPWLLQRGLC